MWNEIQGAIRHQLPEFNNYLLKDYRKEQVDQSVSYIDTVFREAIKLFNGAITYKGYTILSPEKRIDAMMEHSITKGKYNIQKSELILIEFTFEFEQQLYTTHIYVPYLHNGCIVINDTKYYVQLAIIERIIYRTQDCIVIKVMRSPMHFWRTEQYSYVSMEGKSFYDTIITVKVHYKSRKRSKNDIKTALMLYPLCTRGFAGTLDAFGVSQKDMYLSESYIHVDGYMAFRCRDDVYLNVNESLMSQVTIRRMVASMVYLFSFFTFYTFADLFDLENSAYKIMLGRAIFGPKYKTSLACSQASTHLESLATYLDPITKMELAKQGVICDDIHDLFVNVFSHLDEWLINHAPNDLYEKKVGVLELLMVDLTKAIFTRCYTTLQRQKNLNDKAVRSLFRMPNSKITGIYKSSLVRGITCYNDNELLSLMGKKVRQAANQDSTNKKTVNLITAKEHRFHTSFPVVESILSIPSSSPGVSGSINPYVEITRGDGCFVKPDYAADIDLLDKDLPSR